jgi:hypothetical protein
MAMRLPGLPAAQPKAQEKRQRDDDAVRAQLESPNLDENGIHAVVSSTLLFGD